ncbi:hypothetical protein N322_09748 [Cariama cristata]|uniref:Uncharacterized protein n=1 Tax=Cariama cristata TaxID=54380 RepID=A0A091M2M7_CARIC|nr:hypothetical protein N322_09748 [Cariama cristata]
MLSKGLGVCYVEPLQNSIPSFLSWSRSADPGLTQATYWKLILADISYISDKFKSND